MASKRITQSTFDDVVRENIEDLEMEAQEAIDEAVAQFEAQGVQLNNIITDLVISTDGSSWHPVINAVSNLKAVDISDKPALEKTLSQLREDCDKSLAHRCMAASNGAYDTLINVLESLMDANDVPLLDAALATLCSMINGQPDLVMPEHMSIFLKLVKEAQDTICLLGVRLIKYSCIMHESHRQQFIAEGVILVLAGALKKHKADTAIVKESCQALRTLTFDDDPRVPFGKAHDHAKMIVMEADALELLMDIAKEHTDQTVLGELFTTVGRLAVRNEFCLRIMDLGGLDLMLETLHKNMSHKVIASQIIGVLKAIAGNDDVKVAIARSVGPSVIVATMDKHQGAEALAANACSCLATIVLRNPDNCKAVIDCLGHVAIVQAMKIHNSSSSVQKQGCMALRNLVARTRQNCDLILPLGAEAIIQKALNTFPDVKDEAKAALRDLGCKVELKERWTGEKGDLERGHVL